MTRGARQRAGSQRGSAALESVAGIGFMLLVLVAAWQSVVWLQQRGQAEADARTLARVAVICPKPQASLGLSDVDSADGTATVRSNGDDTVTVTVSLAPALVVPGLQSLPAPVAAVTMHTEPC